MSSLSLDVVEAADHPTRLARCEALRRGVLQGAAAVSSASASAPSFVMDASAPPQPSGWLATVHHGEVLVGCMNIRSSAQRPFRAEAEFVLGSQLAAREDLVEGSLFAVLPEHRGNGVVGRVIDEGAAADQQATAAAQRAVYRYRSGPCP